MNLAELLAFDGPADFDLVEKLRAGFPAGNPQAQRDGFGCESHTTMGYRIR